MDRDLKNRSFRHCKRAGASAIEISRPRRALMLVVGAVLLLSACAAPVIDRVAIRDWEPSIRVSTDSEVTIKSSRDEVRIFYRKEF